MDLDGRTNRRTPFDSIEPVKRSVPALGGPPPKSLAQPCKNS